jgi:hypothetical protein
MPTFPKKETEIIALAQMVGDGLSKMADDFPHPPLAVADLQAKVTEYNGILSATVEADMASQRQHAAKAEVLAEIRDGVSANLRYAEITARKEPEKLAGLGWGPRRDKSPLAPPGEVRDINIDSQGDTWLILSWHPPVNGGLTAAYHIERKQGTGAWEAAATSATTEKSVTDQPRGVELSYRVIAVNKAGSGAPSGVVTAVL